MLARTVLLALTLLLVPLGTRAADLLIWWEKGYYPAEDKAVRETVTEFEGKTGKTVKLILGQYAKLKQKIQSAVEAGQPPDFIFTVTGIPYYNQWAYEGRLVDLTDAVGELRSLFDSDALDEVMFLDGTTGKRGLYALPMGRSTNHLHVWRSLLKLAAFKLQDIPKEWEPFWSFWCDKAQPAVRKALGRDDIWGVGLAMSVEADDTDVQFWQFVNAYNAHYVTRDGRLIVDDPLVRSRLVKVLDSYTAIYRKGCTPPDAVDWDNRGNNKAFLDQKVLMTPNNSLSVTNALKELRPEDYYNNAATIEWPAGADGQPLVFENQVHRAVVFREGGHVATAKEFVRFLIEDGWLAHYLNFAGDRMMPPMRKLLEAPFWLDTGDPHRMRSAIQFLTQPRGYTYEVVTGNWRHRRVWEEYVWGRAIHSVATGAATPEQAVDVAIARIRQILSEPEANQGAAR